MTWGSSSQSGSSSHNSFQTSIPASEQQLSIGMCFDRKESTVSYIKQYHIDIMVLDLWLLRANLINIYVNVSTTKRVGNDV